MCFKKSRDVRIVNHSPCPDDESPVLSYAVSAKREHTSMERLYRKSVSSPEDIDDETDSPRVRASSWYTPRMTGDTQDAGVYAWSQTWLFGVDVHRRPRFICHSRRAEVITRRQPQSPKGFVVTSITCFSPLVSGTHVLAQRRIYKVGSWASLANRSFAPSHCFSPDLDQPRPCPLFAKNQSDPRYAVLEPFFNRPGTHGRKV